MKKMTLEEVKARLALVGQAKEWTVIRYSSPGDDGKRFTKIDSAAEYIHGLGCYEIGGVVAEGVVAEITVCTEDDECMAAMAYFSPAVFNVCCMLDGGSDENVSNPFRALAGIVEDAPCKYDAIEALRHEFQRFFSLTGIITKG